MEGIISFLLTYELAREICMIQYFDLSMCLANDHKDIVI